MLRLLALLLALSSPALSAQRVSVTDLGADSTGGGNSSAAFQQAHNQAGPRGIVECDPGFYRLDEEWIIFHDRILIDCENAWLIAGSPMDSVVRVMMAEPNAPQLYMVRLRLGGINGQDAADCLSVHDSNFGDFQVSQMHRCLTAVFVQPLNTRTADNSFRGLLWGHSETGIKMRCAGHHVQSNRFDVNFLANNQVGIDIREGRRDFTGCASMFWFRGSMDQFKMGRDGWVKAPNSLVESSFGTPGSRKLITSESTYLHILSQDNEHILKSGIEGAVIDHEHYHPSAYEQMFDQK